MNLLKTYINNFIDRAGNKIFIATIFARLFSFLASWIALKLIPNKELGIVLFAYNIIAFLMPVSGLGLHQSLIRFGALLKTNEEKKSLFLYVLKKGTLATLVIILLIICTTFWIPFQFKNTNYYIAFLAIIMLPKFIFEVFKVQFRLKHNNKEFANAEIIFNTILVFLVLILSYFYKEKGYALALLLTPTFTLLFFIKKLNISLSNSIKLNITDIYFWKYGFFASLSNVLTQLLFIIDILLIGYMLNDPEMVTTYKYISLIPISLLFLPRVFINTDFVAFTENVFNRKYIINYIKSYILLFSLISILICFFFGIFSKNVLKIFSINFTQYNDSFLILIFGICGILIFRGLFGNLLSSIGKAHINFYITSIALIINVFSNYYLIPEYGIIGAAITSAFLMWFTGIFSTLWFFYLYRKV